MEGDSAVGCVVYDARQQGDPDSLEALHARMREIAASLGAQFGRSSNGKHTQDVFSLRYGDMKQAALGLVDFMGVDGRDVSTGIHGGTGSYRGVTLNPRP